MNSYLVLDENRCPLRLCKWAVDGTKILLTSTNSATLFASRSDAKKAVNKTARLAKNWDWHISEWKIIRCEVQS